MTAVDGIDWEGQPVLPLSQTQLTLSLKQTTWGLTGMCVYKQDQLGAERIERLLARYVTVLARASLDFGTTLRDLAVSEERLP